MRTDASVSRYVSREGERMSHFDVIEHCHKWIVCVDGCMVLECKSRRIALATVRRANDLMRAAAEHTMPFEWSREPPADDDQPIPIAATNSRRTSAGWP